jgi:hypothetical protein
MYEDLDEIKKSTSLLDKLRPRDDAQVSRIRQQEPLAPGDYIEFLRRFGAGEIGSSQYVLYDRPFEPHEIYGRTPPGLETVLLFGDDKNGYVAGFDRGTWKVVERDRDDGTVKPIADTFSAFIRTRLANLRSR